MPIKICDAIMGSGKSSAIIHHMNQNSDKKFIYITPFLDETERIRNACPSLRFIEPSNKLSEYGFSKYNHVIQLLKDQRNIASTHQMFRHFKPEILDLIRAGHYTLVVDEAVDVFKEFELKKDDLDIACKMGWIKEDGGNAITEDTPEYQGDRFQDVFDLASNGSFVITSKGGDTYYWVMSQGFFEAFEDVYILTYLFPAQTLKYYFDMHRMAYHYIGIEHPDEHTYHFSDDGGYIPEYVGTLSEKIHILDHAKMNRIGDHKTALSVKWFQRHKLSDDTELDKIRRHLQNYFKNICSDIPAECRMWSSFKDVVGSLRGKGYYNSNLAFNSRATNAYRHKRALAYCVNIFMKPEEKRYFQSHGVDVREDEAALSTMVQWIWRSAIRDGEEIWIYIPSRRMRNLLIEWMRDIERKYDDYKRATMIVPADLTEAA